MQDGRQLNYQTARFLTSAPGLAQCPPDQGAEVAFAGRSNAGKSSAINALTQQRALARTSKTPGRTQLINFFTLQNDDQLRLVDLPGYGYAKAPKDQVDAWTRLVFDYLRGRSTLKRVYLLIDARHGIKANDAEVMTLLDKAAVSYQIVLTKSDKMKDGPRARLISKIQAEIAKHTAAHPEICTTSAVKGTGIASFLDGLGHLAASEAPQEGRSARGDRVLRGKR